MHEVGVITAQTPFGYTVSVYDMEWTICDLLRNRSRMEIQVFQDAFKQYVRRKDKNLRMPLKIDISTGDVITPHEVRYSFKLILEQMKDAAAIFDEVEKSPVMGRFRKFY